MRGALVTAIAYEGRAIHYTYTLTPVYERDGERIEEITITCERGATIIYANGTRRQSKSPLGSPYWGNGDEPAEHLQQWSGYVETPQSRLRRLRGRWDDLGNPPQALYWAWPHLDETAKLAALLVAEHAAKQASEADATHKRAVARAYAEGQYDARQHIRLDDEALRRGLEAFVRSLIPFPEGAAEEEDDGDEYYD